MSFYRSMVAAVAAFGLASVVFAADENTQQLAQADNSGVQVQTNDQATKVNVNTASAKDLAQVKGLTAAKAKAIVSYRNKHGEFKSLDDLKMVKGFKKMNDETMKQVQDQLSLS